MVRFYQRNISPYTPSSCRYHPTCSSYMLSALEKHGAFLGTIMGLARIIRCNPFVPPGVDEVPDYFTIFRNPANEDDDLITSQLMRVSPQTMEEIDALYGQYADFFAGVGYFTRCQRNPG